MGIKNNKKKLNLALLINLNYTTRSITNYIWNGVSAACREQNVNIFCIDGKPLKHFTPDIAQQNIIYNMIDTNTFDGLIIWVPSIGTFVSKKDMEQFIDKFRSIPVVLGESIYGDIPSVHIDYNQMMQLAVGHLVKVHHYNKIALIQGPEQLVYVKKIKQAYIDILSQLNIPYDPKLISDPCQRWINGGINLLDMMKKRKLSFGKDIEAIITTKGLMTLRLIKTLYKQQKYTPYDVTLVGFEDSSPLKKILPDITYIETPYYQMGYESVKMLLNMINGIPVKKIKKFPIDLHIRQSCGCNIPQIIKTKPVMDNYTAMIKSSSRESLKIDLLKLIKEELNQITDTNSEKITFYHYIKQITNAFVSEIYENNRGSLYQTFEIILRNSTTENQNLEIWQDIIAVLRKKSIYCLKQEKHTQDIQIQAEDIWHKIQILYSVIKRDAEMTRDDRITRIRKRLIELSDSIIVTIELDEFISILLKDIPSKLEIEGGYIVFFNNTNLNRNTIKLKPDTSNVYIFGKTLDFEKKLINLQGSSKLLIPDEFLTNDKPYCFIVKPLFYSNQQMGIVALTGELNDINLYERLRRELSSILYRLILLQKIKMSQDELVKYRDHLEDLVKQRTDALARINTNLHDQIIQKLKIEKNLRDSEKQYRLLAETVQEGILIIQKANIVFANEAFLKMTGYSPDEIKKLDFIKFFNLVNKDYFNRVNEKITKLPKQIKRKIFSKTRKTIWVYINSKSIIWNSQQALLLTIQNITSRVEKEKNLIVEKTKLEKENIQLKSAIKERYRFGEIIGKSPVMQEVYKLIINAASAAVNVIIRGESGTGKDLIARTIHQFSPRKDQAFIPVNCASIPDTLFESEFFGHYKGAYTGAHRNKPGLFDKAHKGILFLDEVTELSVSNQAKLLRVLQDGEYTPLGSTKYKKADVLIIAATNKIINSEINNGTLRKDFYYRIGVIEITVPPLRDRKDDLALLIEHILIQYKNKQENIHGHVKKDFPIDQSMLPGKFVQLLYNYEWPGNIRELQNVIQRYLATGNFNSIFPLISNKINHELLLDKNEDFQDKSLSDILQTIEKHFISKVLTENHFSIGKTAKKLQIPLRTFRRRMEQYGLKEK